MMSEEELNTHLEALRSFLIAKSNVVPIIASLSATILVVATFNGQLLKITPYFKIALSALLLLIPLSLFAYLAEFNLAIEKTKKMVEELVGCKDLLSNQTLKNKVFNTIIYWFPFFGNAVLLIVVIYIILAIWQCI